MAPVIRGVLAVVALIALVLAGYEVIEEVRTWLATSLMPHTEDMLHNAIILGTLIYIVLLALPFVPGAEIGLTLLTVLGGSVAPLVYLATAFSLSLAYTAGRLLPVAVLERALSLVGLKRAAALVADLSGMSEAEMQAHLLARGGSRLKTFALRHRYLGLILIFNLPGNAVIGGGGGIALMAGLSRMFQPLPFLLSVLIAVLPVPLLFFLGAS